MNAIILAAGKGERLNDITKVIPKPMIEVNGKPLLRHNIELCKKYGITKVFINLHHLPEKIKNYFRNGENFGIKISYSFEESLLGTAGAVKKILNDYPEQFEAVSENDLFFLLYGDNYSNYNLDLLVEMHKKTQAECIIAFHYREDVSHSGVAEFDNNSRIIKFIEKPKDGETNSHWVNAGIYLISKNIFKYLNPEHVDFGKDVFPLLLNLNKPIYGVCADAEVKAYDTPQMYIKNIE